MSCLHQFVGQDQDDGGDVDSQNENVDADAISCQELEARYGREKPIKDLYTCT